MEGLLGMSPLLILFSLIGIVYGLLEKNKFIIIFTILSLLQIAICTFFMLGVSGRGYVTFTCSASFVLLSVYGLSRLLANKYVITRLFALIGLISFGIFAHFSKITGIRLPLMGFYSGYFLNIQQNKWQSYDIHIIP